jgi:hypothetical protein
MHGAHGAKYGGETLDTPDLECFFVNILPGARHIQKGMKVNIINNGSRRFFRQ